MAAAKPKSKKGKKPGSKHHRMAKKSAPKGAEVGGRMSPGAFYACWNCGTVNFVPSGWDYFLCAACAAFNGV